MQDDPNLQLLEAAAQALEPSWRLSMDAGPVTISTVMTSKTSSRLSTDEKSWLPTCETHR